MKSYIKKNDILNYILNKFNDDNATQDINFIMGSEGLPLYKPISFEGANGVPDEYEFFDEQTYQISKEQSIPLSIPVINAEYMNLRTIEGNRRINSSEWSVVISFLVYANSYVHNKLVFGIEEFRDKSLGSIDIINVKQWDYADEESSAIHTYYTVVSTSSDLIPGELLTINGDIFLEYTLQINLDVSEGIDYGNQYELYIAKGKTEGNFNFERVIPIDFSWGVNNSMKPNQLLKNEVELQTASNHTSNKYKAIHNLIDTKTFSLNMVLLKEQNQDSIVDDLFEETYKFYFPLNKPYQVQLKYRPIIGSEGQKTFGEAIEKFNYSMVVMESSVEMSNGEDISFSVTLVPSWNEVV
jgi:hypothetical protein